MSAKSVPSFYSVSHILRRLFVYLAYLDDSDTKGKAERWQVLSAVLIRDDTFIALEGFSSFVIADLMPEERRAKFEEFHACELYGGYGAFEGIEQARRFAAIESLLTLLHALGAKVVYGAIDLEHLKKQVYSSANPLDVSFKMCAEGVQQWLFARDIELIEAKTVFGGNIALFIADDCDKANKATMQASFRSMRPRVRPPSHEACSLPSVHDDMYFGDSKFSIGIQLADLCSYFIARHLAGDLVTEPFFKLLEPQIVSGKHEP